MGNRDNVWVVLAAAFVVGCGAAGADGDGVEQQTGNEAFVSNTQSALTGCGCSDSSYTTFTVTGTTKNTGHTFNEHVCWPTRIDKNFFDPLDADLIVYPDVATGKWIAIGTGEVQCAPQCCFFSNGSADVRALQVPHSRARAVWPSPNGAIANLWEPDSMPIIIGVKFWRGTSDQHVFSTIHSPTNQLHALIAAGATGTVTTGYATSFFVGPAHTGSTPNYKEYTWSSRTSETSHISSSAGICTFNYLHTVNAAPSGTTYARLRRTAGVWKSQVFGNADAKVRCLYFNQDQ